MSDHLPTTEHAEALGLARRLQCSDARTAADDRRALLLFWYGSGASRLKAEEDVLLAAWRRHGGDDHPLSAAVRAEHARLADEIAAIAADAHTSAARLRHAGDALGAHVFRQDRELCRVVEHAVPPGELDAVAASLRGLRR
jgi:hypothetical protein